MAGVTLYIDKNLDNKSGNEMGYFTIDLYTQFVGDWQKTFEIVNSFLGKLDHRHISGHSFNRYSGLSPLPYLTMRFNFVNNTQGKHLVEKIADDLIERRLIVGKGEWQPFNVSSSVIKATETSTKVSLLFKDWLDENQEASGFYLQNQNTRIQFMSRFLMIFLLQLGFHTSFEKYPVSEQLLNLIRACATHCSEQVREVFPQEPDIDFMERFIHHFLNCVHISLEAERVMNVQIKHWQWLNELISNRNSN